MKNKSKTKEKLINELEELRKRIAEFEKADTERKKVEKELKTANQQLEASNQQLMASEQQLRETSNYLESLINYANAPIIVWDTEERITHFNYAFEKLTGYTAREFIGQELHMLFPETTRDESLNKINRTLNGKYWESVEIPILCKDGDSRIVLWNSANIYAEDGRTLSATIAQGQDITERKQAEEGLKRQLDQLEVYYKVTVGREERVVELKHEVNELLKRLGKKKKYVI